VHTTVAKARSDDFHLIKILHESKKLIAENASLKIAQLKYKDLQKKEIDEETVELTFTIVNQKAESNYTSLRTVNLTSNYGTSYKDMALYLDLYPTNPSGKDTTLEDIMLLLSANNIPTIIVDRDTIQNHISSLLLAKKPIKDILLAQGTFPEEGRDAELKYFCNIKKVSSTEFIGTDKVEKGMMVCKKFPLSKGTKDGMNVKGEVLPPKQSKDIILKAGENVYLSASECEVFASAKGILRIRQEASFKPIISQVLIFSVEAIEEIDGSKPLNITVDKPIEIIGGVKSGSKVISQKEVIIIGDVESGAVIQTSGNILINGNIIGGEMTSSKDIEGLKDVTLSRLTAEGKIVVKGITMNSELSGHEIYLNEVSGCNITAGSKIEINKIIPSETGLGGRLTVGIVYHLNQIKQENLKFIDVASKNLERLKEVFGEEILRYLEHSNVNHTLIIHAENLKKLGFQINKREQKELVKQIFSAVVPTKEMIKERELNIQEIEKQKQKASIISPQIVINEVLNQTTAIEMEGLISELLSGEGPVRCEICDNNIVKIPI
jgi:uncharacterized protein (DUF342 family)